MFSKARVGDRVWSIRFGWGTIRKIDTNLNYPIRVHFDNGNGLDGYKYDGRFGTGDQIPDLYWDEVKIVPPPQPKRIVNHKVVKYCNIYQRDRKSDLGVDDLVGEDYVRGIIDNNAPVLDRVQSSGRVAIAKVTFEFQTEE